MASLDSELERELDSSNACLYMAAKALEDHGMKATAAHLRLQAEKNQKVLLWGHT